MKLCGHAGSRSRHSTRVSVERQVTNRLPTVTGRHTNDGNGRIVRVDHRAGIRADQSFKWRVCWEGEGLLMAGLGLKVSTYFAWRRNCAPQQLSHQGSPSTRSGVYTRLTNSSGRLRPPVNPDTPNLTPKLSSAQPAQRNKIQVIYIVMRLVPIG